jgi:hypothetical protein
MATNSHSSSARWMTRSSVAHQKQRRVAQLHPFARFHSQRGHPFRIDLRDKFLDAARNLHAVLVELPLPQHAGENSAPERLLRRNDPGLRSLVGARPRLLLENIQAHGDASFQKLPGKSRTRVTTKIILGGRVRTCSTAYSGALPDETVPCATGRMLVAAD